MYGFHQPLTYLELPRWAEAGILRAGSTAETDLSTAAVGTTGPAELGAGLVWGSALGHSLHQEEDH